MGQVSVARRFRKKKKKSQSNHEMEVDPLSFVHHVLSVNEMASGLH